MSFLKQVITSFFHEVSQFVLGKVTKHGLPMCIFFKLCMLFTGRGLYDPLSGSIGLRDDSQGYYSYVSRQTSVLS